MQQNIDEINNLVTAAISHKMKTSIPNKIITIRLKDKHFINNEIRRLIRQQKLSLTKI